MFKTDDKEVASDSILFCSEVNIYSMKSCLNSLYRLWAVMKTFIMLPFKNIFGKWVVLQKAYHSPLENLLSCRQTSKLKFSENSFIILEILHTFQQIIEDCYGLPTDGSSNRIGSTSYTVLKNLTNSEWLVPDMRSDAVISVVFPIL